MNYEFPYDFMQVLRDVKFRNYEFVAEFTGDRMYLQGQYLEADNIVTGKVELQKTRKWLLSEHMTKSEFVQTVFKCALTSMEHRTREHFLYKNERVYSPHYDVEALVELCRAERFDESEDWYAEGRAKKPVTTVPGSDKSATA